MSARPLPGGESRLRGEGTVMSPLGRAMLIEIVGNTALAAVFFLRSGE